MKRSWSVERGLGHEFANSIGTHEEMQKRELWMASIPWRLNKQIEVRHWSNNQQCSVIFEASCKNVNCQIFTLQYVVDETLGTNAFAQNLVPVRRGTRNVL